MNYQLIAIYCSLIEIFGSSKKVIIMTVFLANPVPFAKQNKTKFDEKSFNFINI